MTQDVGILFSAHDPVRDLVKELADRIASCGGAPSRMLIEDLAGGSRTEGYPGTIFVLSSAAEVWQTACWLAQGGCRVVNSGFFASGGDRIAVQLRLAVAGVPILPFAFAAHPAMFKDRDVWNTYPAIIKSLAKQGSWPVFHDSGDMHDWVDSTRPHRFGWLIEEFVPTAVTTKYYFVGECSWVVDKRARNDMDGRTNDAVDVSSLGRQVAKALRLEVGSVDMVRDEQGALWPIDANPIPAFRLWPDGYQHLGAFLVGYGR